MCRGWDATLVLSSGCLFPSLGVHVGGAPVKAVCSWRFPRKMSKVKRSLAKTITTINNRNIKHQIFTRNTSSYSHSNSQPSSWTVCFSVFMRKEKNRNKSQELHKITLRPVQKIYQMHRYRFNSCLPRHSLKMTPAGQSPITSQCLSAVPLKWRSFCYYAEFY